MCLQCDTMITSGNRVCVRKKKSEIVYFGWMMTDEVCGALSVDVGKFFFYVSSCVTPRIVVVLNASRNTRAWHHSGTKLS